MYTRITLYKSGFTLGDIFVGASKSDRAAQLAALPQLVLPVSSYNAARPFRISGNYLLYSRVWDYAKFELATEENLTDAQTRYYFIQTFEYVNDNVTDMVCIEDVLGNLWYDITYTRIAPARYTWPEGQESSPNRGLKKASADFDNHIYNFEKIFDNRLSVTINGNIYYIGVIVNVATYTGLTYYYEDGVKYPYEIDLLPFLYRDTGIISQWDFAAVGANGTQSNIISVAEFELYCTQNSPGFELVNNYIMYDTADIFTAVWNGTRIVLRRKGADVELITNNHTIDNKTILSLGSYNVTQNITITLPNTPLAKSPYMTIRCIGTTQQVDIDPILFGTTADLKIKKSYIPPVNVTLYAEATTPDIMAFQALKSYDLGEYPTFGVLIDSYTEFIRNNYNSTVTGLAIRQSAEQQQLGLAQQANMRRALLGAAGNILGGAASAGRSKTAEGAAASYMGGIYNAGATLINAGLDNALAYSSMELKQETEQTLLNLKLADIAATPDNVNINGSLGISRVRTGFLSLYLGVTPSLEFFTSYHKAFGYAYPQEITTRIRAHTNFDYIRVSDITISDESAIKLSQLEQKQFCEQLASGVRVWYDLSNYKNFLINSVYTGE